MDAWTGVAEGHVYLAEVVTSWCMREGPDGWVIWAAGKWDLAPQVSTVIYTFMIRVTTSMHFIHEDSTIPAEKEEKEKLVV